jgi:hypothetical protein
MGGIASGPATLDATIMRITTIAICVALLVASHPFPANAISSSEEKRIEDRLARTKTRLADVMLKDIDAKELVKRSRIYVARAETALANHHPGFAGPLSEAAEALSRAVDHVAQSRDVTRTDYPSRYRLSERMEAVGHRVQQADYFQKLGKDPAAKALVGLARRYNQRARDSFHNGKRRETDEYTTAADEIVRALEFIAHVQISSDGQRRG